MSPDTVVFLAFGLLAAVGASSMDRRARSGLDFLSEGQPPQTADEDIVPFRAAVRIGFVRSQLSRCSISRERITMRVRVPGGAGDYFVERSDVERATTVPALTGGRGIRFVSGGKVHDGVTLWVPGGDEWHQRLRDYGWAQRRDA